MRNIILLAPLILRHNQQQVGITTKWSKSAICMLTAKSFGSDIQNKNSKDFANKIKRGIPHLTYHSYILIGAMKEIMNTHTDAQSTSLTEADNQGASIGNHEPENFMIAELHVWVLNSLSRC